MFSGLSESESFFFFVVGRGGVGAVVVAAAMVGVTESCPSTKASSCTHHVKLVLSIRTNIHFIAVTYDV